MAPLSADFDLARREFANAAKPRDGAALETPGLSVAGNRAFLFTIALGFLIGFLLIPLAGGELRGAIIAFGALCLMVATARRAHLAEARAEQLQCKLLDEASYHAFVDSAIEGFFRTTRDGRYIICNPALAAIYGYGSPDQLTQEVTDIASTIYVDPARREEFTRLTGENGVLQDFVSQIRRRDGAIIWISENARKVTDEDGQFLFYEGTVEDITAKIESDLAMRKALQETRDAAQAKAAFLAAMSHELKTPLNAIIGFSDLMMQGLFGPVEPERYRSYVGDIHANGGKLLTMVNDILDLVRIEGKLMALDETEISVADALEAASNAVTAAGQSAPAIGIQVSPALPLLKADAKRLRQILNHILSNAVKFAAANDRIEARVSLTVAGGIAIAIEDTGIGMEPEMIQHALEPFKQLDGSLARRFEGAGLGLPLASALMRLHDGRLTIDSTLGTGTTVTIEFPAERTVEFKLAKSA